MKFYFVTSSVTVNRGWFRKKPVSELFGIYVVCENGNDFTAYNKDRKVNPGGRLSVMGPSGQALLSKRSIAKKLSSFIDENCKGALDVAYMVSDGTDGQLAGLFDLLTFSPYRGKATVISESIEGTLSKCAAFLPDEEFSLGSEYTLIVEKGDRQFSVEEKVKMIKTHPLYLPVNKNQDLYTQCYRLQKRYSFVSGLPQTIHETEFSSTDEHNS